MSCFQCLFCNDYNEVDQRITIPDIIQGTVHKIIDAVNIIVSYKIENSNNFYHYYIRLSNITPFPETQTVAIKALSELLLCKQVTVQNINNFNYNSMDAKVFYNNICINNWVVYNKFAHHNPLDYKR